MNDYMVEAKSRADLLKLAYALRVYLHLKDVLYFAIGKQQNESA